MRSNQMRRAFPHTIDVQPAAMVTHISAGEWADYIIRPYPIAVDLGRSRVASVEFLTHRIDAHNSNISIEIAVNCVSEYTTLHFAIQKEISNLTFGMHPGIGAARSVNCHRPMLEQRDRSCELALNRAAVWLNLPAVIIGAVVLDGDLKVTHSPNQFWRAFFWSQSDCDQAQGFGFRLPGFTTGRPCLHSGQSEGSYAGTSRVKRETRRTPTSAAPLLLSTIEPAPITFPPAAVTASIVSRVEPPVVTTSSTTRTRSPGFNSKPRRSVIKPVSRSVNNARQPTARAVS